MANYTQYRDSTESTERAKYPTVEIWADCPTAQLMHDPGLGFFHHDDFRGYTETATTVGSSGGLPTFEGNTTITMVASGDQGSALQLFSTDDNQEASLQVGETGTMSIGDAGKLWFEARIKKSSVSVTSCFVGLAQAGAGVADFINDANADFADVSLIGFNVFEADPDAFDFTYQNSGQAFNTLIGDAKVVTADTYTKLGFVYDPSAIDAEKIKVYVDGVEQSTYVTQALMDAAAFPKGDSICPLIAIKAFSNTDGSVTLDWWRAAYLK